MNCQQLRSGEFLEDYLLRRLPETESAAVELHIFECDACFEELRLLTAARLVLSEERAPKALPAGRWFWFSLAAAAAAVLLLWTWYRQPPAPAAIAVPAQPAPVTAPATQHPLLALARFQPPKYTSPILRGTEDQAAADYSAAMARYAAGDYRAAAIGLRKAATEAPQAPAPAFYLGICLLATGQPGAALEPLQHAAASGDSAFAESAQFYLAEAYLGLERAPEARRALEHTAALHGDLESEAHRILVNLDKLSTQR